MTIVWDFDPWPCKYQGQGAVDPIKILLYYIPTVSTKLNLETTTLPISLNLKLTISLLSCNRILKLPAQLTY